MCISHIQLISHCTCSLLERPSFRFSDNCGTVQPQIIAQIIVSICGREHKITRLGAVVLTKHSSYSLTKRQAIAMERSYGGVIEHSCFLVYDAASRSKWFFTFRRNPLLFPYRTEYPMRDDLELLTIIF